MVEVRILHCIHSLSWGGLEIYTAELIQKLAQAGFSQTVLCAAQGRVFEALNKANQNLQPSQKMDLVPFPEKKMSKLKAALLIRRLCRAHRITHLHSHTRLDMWAAALSLWQNPLRKNGLRHFYNLYMNATPKQGAVHRWLFSYVDALCSSSEKILQDVRQNFPIANEKLHLIPYGRETALYQSRPRVRAELREKWGVLPQQIVIGTLCRIDPGKGVRELARSLEYLNDHELSQLQLWIIGDPTTIGKNPDGSAIYEAPSAELSAWLEDFQQNPRFKKHLLRLGFQTDYLAYVDSFDVFALASYNETYSLSVIDAMMMGKPVIGTKAGGTPEQIGSQERGLLAEPKDPESLALAIRHYLQHPEDRSLHGEKARAWALAHHDWAKVIELYKKLYGNLETPLASSTFATFGKNT